MGSRESFGERMRTHGMTETRLYKTWCGMKARCYNKNTAHYERYGGRGITVCDEWLTSFENFMSWAVSAGYNGEFSSKEQSLDRVDVNGNYSPENCRWVSLKRQARNRADTVYVNFNEKEIPAREFAERFCITDYVFVFRRAKKGQTGERILSDWGMRYNTPKNLMRVKDAALEYGVTAQTIQDWIKTGRLVAEKHGQIIVIPKGQKVERDASRDKKGRFLKTE